MGLYVQNYLNVIKKNFMLIIIASVPIVLTFFIWAGFPIFIIGGIIADTTTNLAIIYSCISFSGGFLFSLFFLPINIIAGKHIAHIKKLNVIKSIIQIHAIFILICSLLFGLVMICVLQI